jgi:hypothetical protein
VFFTANIAAAGHGASSSSRPNRAHCVKFAAVPCLPSKDMLLLTKRLTCKGQQPPGIHEWVVGERHHLEPCAT